MSIFLLAESYTPADGPTVAFPCEYCGRPCVAPERLGHSLARCRFCSKTVTVPGRVPDTRKPEVFGPYADACRAVRIWMVVASTLATVSTVVSGVGFVVAIVNESLAWSVLCASAGVSSLLGVLAADAVGTFLLAALDYMAVTRPGTPPPRPGTGG